MSDWNKSNGGREKLLIEKNGKFSKTLLTCTSLNGKTNVRKSGSFGSP